MNSSFMIQPHFGATPLAHCNLNNHTLTIHQVAHGFCILKFTVSQNFEFKGLIYTKLIQLDFTITVAFSLLRSLCSISPHH